MYTEYKIYIKQSILVIIYYFYYNFTTTSLSVIQ